MLKEEGGLEFLENTGVGYLAISNAGEVFTSTSPSHHREPNYLSLENLNANLC